MYKEQLHVKKMFELFEEDIINLINTHGTIKRVSDSKDGKVYHIEFLSQEKLNEFLANKITKTPYLVSGNDKMIQACYYFYETYLKDYISKDKSKSTEQKIEDFEKDVASMMKNKYKISSYGLYEELILLKFKKALIENLNE